MKIIFLDIDGVLNAPEYFLEAELRGDESIYQVASNKLALVEHLVSRTNAKIVISSTWRYYKSINEIYEIFKSKGFNLPRTSIVGKTPSMCVNPRMGLRTQEISTYLEGKDVDSYVILDDYGLLEDVWIPHQHNIVLVNREIGLTLRDVAKAENILGKSEKVIESEKEWADNLAWLTNYTC